MKETYIGTRPHHPLHKQGGGNINKVWELCEDGKFRSKDSDIVLTREQINSDVNNGHLVKKL